MVDVFSLSNKGFMDCGSSCGCSETVFLYECRDDVTAHLKNVFCRMQTSEYKVILQRAGFECCVSTLDTKEHLTASKVKT